MMHSETRIGQVLLAAHTVKICFPAFAVWRVGKHEVELHRREGVEGERGTVFDILCGLTFSFQQQVCFADGVSFGIDLLPEEMDRDFLAMFTSKLVKRFLSDGEHSPGTARAVIDAVSGVPDVIGYGHKDQISHELYHIAGRKMLAGLFVVFFVKAPNELLEDRSHGMIVQTRQADIPVLVEHGIGTEVNIV